jgi:hypothetical protein
MIDFSAFEGFEGERPYLLLEKHPDGKHLALQVATADVFLAAVWNNDTKRLVWFPKDAHGLAWLHQGTQIAALQNPLLSGDFLFAIYSWPQGHLLQQCPLRFPMGYRFDLIISPANDLAVCQWTDQCEFGFEFITLGNHSVAQLTQHGYINRKTMTSTRPVFRPDGRFWVCGYQEKTSWWINEDRFENDTKPVQGGQNEIGAVVVFQGTKPLGEIPLIVNVPVGYLPPDLWTLDGSSNEMLYISDPIFIDIYHIMIHLPSGESQVCDLSTILDEPTL